MNKHILLSLLITSSAFMYGMENESSFPNSFSFSSFFSTLFSSNEIPNGPMLISDLQKSKDGFENELLNDNEEKIKQVLRTQPIGSFLKINRYPIWFLQYCYYQEIIKHLDENLTTIATLPSCKNMQINGYTALGAAIISKEPSIDKKRSFIQKLLNSGFEQTSKDTELAKLMLYNATTKNHKTLLYLLHPHSEINWSVLPQDIRSMITQNMIQLFKKEFWLLPEISLSDL